MLAIIACCQGLPLERVYIIFGGLDMLPRINMAIKLARAEKWPRKEVNRIIAIRKELQDGLQDKRNQAVHGVHDHTEGETYFTMARWQGDKRRKSVTVSEMFETADSLNRLAMEAFSIFEDYGEWKLGKGSS